MLELKNLVNDKDSDSMQATYEVIHNDDLFRTILTQDFTVTICRKTGAIKGALHITDLAAPSMPEALAKLAIWCERMAMALREPMTVVASVPVYKKDWNAVPAKDPAQLLGLTWTRLLALGSVQAGGSRSEIADAAQELYQDGYITYPKSDVEYLPARDSDTLDDVFNTVERAFPGITKGATPLQEAPVFISPFPYAHHAIIPAPMHEVGASEFFKLSELARSVYRIVVEEYVLCVGSPPATEPQPDDSSKTA